MILPVMLGLQSLVSLSERQAEEAQMDVGQDAAIRAKALEDLAIITVAGKSCYIRLESKETCPQELE